MEQFVDDKFFKLTRNLMKMIMFIVGILIVILLVLAMLFKTSESIDVSGILVPENSETVFSLEKEGRIKEIFVQDGDSVKEDQPLIEFEESLWELEKKTLEQKIEILKIQLAVSENEFKKNKSEISKKEIKNIRDEIALNENKLRAIQDYINNDCFHIKTLNAPFDGIIYSLINLSDYDTNSIKAGTKLLSIGDFSSWIIKVKIHETDIMNISEGFQTKIYLTALPYIEHGIFNGKIIKISPTPEITEKGTYYETLISIEDQNFQKFIEEEKIRPGLNANVKIILFEDKIIKIIFQKFFKSVK
ncbi:MAG: HlyD family efflux transporter periplasmic adaptor subunit [bacterium]|nr:HlyD family efflux transporter periplasmic adaptor subunit [bacterium]